MGERAFENEGGTTSEEKRSRVDGLKSTDNLYEDAQFDLAEVEGSFREQLAEEGVEGKAVNKLADRFSDETLAKIEATKEKWTDTLTGLRNKNAYGAELPQLLSMSNRMKQQCSLLMVDFDRFKDVNDLFGHLSGDKALNIFANLIKAQVRSSDIVYRFGGEEFMIFLPNTDSAAAELLGEKIRVAVKNNIIEIANENGELNTLNITVSIGAAGTDQLKDWDEYNENNVMSFLVRLTKFADEAAYTSKEHGRDRVTLYSEALEK